MELTNQAKAIGWLSIAHYCVGFALPAWLAVLQSSASALLLLALPALGLASAAGWLRGRRWACYLLPLTYLPQIVRVVTPDFNLWFDSGFKLFVGLNFGFGTLGVNLFALAMLLWCAFAAAGRLDALDASESSTPAS